MKIKQIFATSVLVIALGGCFGGNNAAKPIDLTILHINDHHSHLDAETTTLNLKDSAGVAKTVTVDLGGFPRVAQAITEISANGGNILKLHGGDAITGDLYFTQSEGAADAAVMNTVCFDAFTLGNHEFDSGDAGLVKFIDFLHADTKNCNTPVLSANLNPAGSSLKQRVQPYTIIQRAGQNIGVIGITAAYKTMHASRPDTGTTLADEVTTAQANIDALRAVGVNKIILMAHEGYDADIAIAAKLDGVDVIVGGDSHTLLGPDSMKGFGLTPAGAYSTELTDKYGKKVCIVQAWQYNYAVGELKVHFDESGDVTTCNGTPHVLVGDTYKVGTVAASTADATAFRAAIDASAGVIRTTAPSATVTTVLAPFKTAKDAMGLQVVGKTMDNLCLRRVPGSKRDVTRSSLGDICNKDANVIAHGGDIQQLVAEAFLAQGKRYGAADIALQNGGGVRTDIKAGDITVGTVYGLLPFKNLLVRMTLSGTEVKSALEEGVDSVMYGTGTGAYPYAAGLRFDVDMNQVKGSRVTNLQFRQSDHSWIVFDMTKNYNVITNNFTSAGGDNYNTLKAVPASRQENTFLDYADSFLQYVKDTGTLSKLPVTEYSTQTYIETP
jgi:5'-nucleotidase